VGSSVEEKVVTNRPDAALEREVRMIDGRKCILEYALKPDFALIHAFRGDREGNLQYAKTARNFNPVMAAAARVTIAEVENLVDAGGIEPESVHTPGIYVRRIVKVDRIAYPIAIG
jgi:3-oxoacid CoA-transferase A subunit